MTTYAVLNQKGGVGKTTVALNLAYTWAAEGHRVLVVDVDKQGAATASLRAEELPADVPTLADVLRQQHDLAHAVLGTDDQWAGIELVAAALDLEDVWAMQAPGMVFRLRRALQPIADRWDRIILDGPPDLGPGTVAACIAADAVIIPTRPERMSMHGVARTVETVNAVRADLNDQVDLAGIVPVAVDSRLTEHQARMDELKKWYEWHLTEAVIPHRLRSDEASGAGKPAGMLTNDAGRVLAGAYGQLADELDTRAAAAELKL